jgi:glucose/arabinose dehydrogenase
MLKKITTFSILVLILFFLGYQNRSKILGVFFSPSESIIADGVYLDSGNDIEVIADNLEIPWEVAFLPNDEILITERPGRLLKIGVDKHVINIEGVEHVGEGGLLGLALHPDFVKNKFIYLYLTTSDNDGLVNRVDRYSLEGNRLVDQLTIVNDIPGAKYHDGGRIEFGPDGYLYITTGDAGASEESQNNKSLNGTILRVGDDGSIPQDNPFDSAVYSYGHRNVQGIAWDNDNNLWSTEHGRSGIKSGFDEINLIRAGQNYGWPIIEGDKSDSSMITPTLHSGEKETWAPGDIEFANGKLFFTGLRGESLYVVTLDGSKVKDIKKYFSQEYGRLRAIRLGPDGYLYLTTSNRDGRGDVQDNDDKLIKINLSVFNTDK